MDKIDKQLAEAIKDLEKVSHMLPGVIILLDLRTMSVAYMSDRGLKILGTTLQELKQMGDRYLTYYFHPDDTAGKKALNMIAGNNTADIYTMFQQVREKRRQGTEWCLYLTALKIVIKDDNDKPVITIASAHPIQESTSFSDKVKGMIHEKKFQDTRKHHFDALSIREKQLLKQIGKGLSNELIAHKLFLSLETVKTHRRNLKKKLEAKTNHDLVYFARAFDLV